jgi:SlyX protein
MDTVTDGRLLELETRVAFQEDTIQKLDDALASQQQQIMDLERQVQLLGLQIKEIEVVPATTGPEAPPPHY